MSDQPEIDVVQAGYADALDALTAMAAGPVLQIGAKASVVDHKERNWRARFAGLPFTGADIEAGDNVDAVVDVCAPLDAVRAALPAAPFGTVICAHVLEHLRRPWIAARNIEELLTPGGLVFVQVPWVQAYHPFPEDFWRFSFAGVAALFERIEIADLFYSGGSSDVIYRVLRRGQPALDPATLHIEAQLFQVLLTAEENRAFLARLSRKRLSLSRGYMPVTVVNVIGRRRRE